MPAGQMEHPGLSQVYPVPIIFPGSRKVSFYNKFVLKVEIYFNSEF